MKKHYGLGSLIFDFIMTIVTGGLWLIWIIIRFLRASLKDATKDLVKKRYLDISLMINDIERVKEIDKNALSLISTQQYNTIIINNKLPEISDLVSIITTFDEPKKIIESQSNISEFITYDEFIEISINEQIIF